MVLNYGAEILKIERRHNDCGETGIGREVDEALKSWMNLVMWV
jgi:hypothetical protein